MPSAACAMSHFPRFGQVGENRNSGGDCASVCCQEMGWFSFSRSRGDGYRTSLVRKNAGILVTEDTLKPCRVFFQDGKVSGVLRNPEERVFGLTPKCPPENWKVGSSRLLWILPGGRWSAHLALTLSYFRDCKRPFCKDLSSE